MIPVPVYRRRISEQLYACARPLSSTRGRGRLWRISMLWLRQSSLHQVLCSRLGTLPLLPEYSPQLPSEPFVQFIKDAFYFRIAKVIDYPTIRVRRGLAPPSQRSTTTVEHMALSRHAPCLAHKKRTYPLQDKSLFLLASPRRFERPTPSLGGKCSIRLSYGDIK